MSPVETLGDEDEDDDEDEDEDEDGTEDEEEEEDVLVLLLEARKRLRGRVRIYPVMVKYQSVPPPVKSLKEIVKNRRRLDRNLCSVDGGRQCEVHSHGCHTRHFRS